MSAVFPLAHHARRIDAIVSIYQRRKAISPDSRQWVADMLDQHPVGDGVAQLQELKTRLDNEILLDQISTRLTS
jgi:hypothetical protein